MGFVTVSRKKNKVFVNLKQNTDKSKFGFFLNTKDEETGKWLDADEPKQSVQGNITKIEVSSNTFNGKEIKKVRITLTEGDEDMLITFGFSQATRDFLNNLFWVKTHFGNLDNLQISAYMRGRVNKEAGEKEYRPYIFVEVLNGVSATSFEKNHQDKEKNTVYDSKTEIRFGEQVFFRYEALHTRSVFENEKLPATYVEVDGGKLIVDGKVFRTYEKLDTFFLKAINDILMKENTTVLPIETEGVLVAESTKVEGEGQTAGVLAEADHDDLPF